MTKRRIIPMLFLCSLIVLLTAHALPQTRSSNQSARSDDAAIRRRLIDAQRRKAAAERERMQRELREKELAKKNQKPRIDRDQQIKEFQERVDKIKKEFLYEKAALGATEEQWKIIKPKLEKVRRLRKQATSVVGLFLAGGSSENEQNIRTIARPKPPTWQWRQPWKGMASSELTDAQQLTKRLIALVQNNNTKTEQFRRTMDSLRKARKEEDQIKRKLDEARKELREGLTLRQEAALVLMKWL